MEWLEKTHTQNRTQFDCDVVVTLEKRANATMLLFKFRKNSIYKIVSNEDYIVLAEDGANIYFKEADAKRGFKIGEWSASVKVVKINLDRLPLTENQLGEYNIEFDSKLGLHYICLNRKLEKSLFWETK